MTSCGAFHPQTFEVKLLHVESRPLRRKNTPGGSGDLKNTPGGSGDLKNTPGGSGDLKNTPGESGDLKNTPGGPGGPGGPGDLEFFVRCELHGADLDVFINSLRKVADDLRTFPEEKGTRGVLLC